ncbi:hypothetical protein BJX63DRAFT_31623 [Aspergillus granulosus]|uniref:Uncharacterized protein n=1 Tax=Aspergillus granulosus TaxID=176169 RepID=A0ABR4HUZ9_9EURO
MSPFHTRPHFNPTVEEVRDETDRPSSHDITPSDLGVSWPELCTQHESVLSSHQRTLQALQGQLQALSDSEGSKLVSSMFERTNKLVMQFEAVKKHIIPRIQEGGPASARASWASTGDSRSSSNQDDVVRSKRRKRARRSDDYERETEIIEQLLPEVQLPFQRSKRKRTDLVIPGGSDDVQNAIPVALETEDISEEVQRRLKIKEERRKRETEVKLEKRKRDRSSLASNGSASSLSLGMKPRKKLKLGGRVNG